MKKIYKILITLWLSVGLGICGYFYIYPNQYRIYSKSHMEKLKEKYYGPQYENGKEFQTYLFGTFVGVIFISGIGFSIGKNEK
jgi:hypothetical protein